MIQWFRPYRSIARRTCVLLVPIDECESCRSRQWQRGLRLPISRSTLELWLELLDLP